jgi:8-oxo-dGTP diphosphatase
MNSTTSSLKTIRVVAAVIERGGSYLITQRRATAVLPLLWEFPGGRVEEGESDEEALKREVLHRLGANITVNTLISFATHSYESYCVDLHLYECVLVGDTVTPRMVNDFRWVRSEDFDKYPFTPADEASMSRLLGES